MQFVHDPFELKFENHLKNVNVFFIFITLKKKHIHFLPQIGAYNKGYLG
jgi:hypothetical protein